MKSPKKRRSWLLPALVALISFVGNLSANLITSGMDNFVTQYRIWLWLFTLLAGMVAIAAAIYDARQAANDEIGQGQPGIQQKGSGAFAQDDGVAAGKRGAAIGGDFKGSQLITGDNNSVTHVRNIYLQSSGSAQVGEADFNQALERYLGWVGSRFGQLSLRGIERRERKSLDLTLGDVYVSLIATLSQDRKEKMHHPERQANRQRIESMELFDEDRKESLQLDMSRLLALSDRLMIVGGPGSGKTTYLHIIASALAQALRSGNSKEVEQYLGLKEPLPLPILVPLSEFNRYRKQLSASHVARDGTLIAFISYWLIRQEAAIGLPDDFFDRLLGQGRSCILLLDGLDEVANERERAIVVEAVKNVAGNYGLRQIVVTCRTRAYRENSVLPEEFRVAEVQPMTPEQVDALAERWCAAAYPSLDAERERDRLQQAIRRMEEVRAKRSESRLIESPLLVTIVAIVHYNQRRLPDERAELYEKCVDVLLEERYKPVSDTTFALTDWGGSLPEKRNLLAFLAFQMMSAGEQAGRSVSEEQLKLWLRPQLVRKQGEVKADEALDTFVTAMRERGSLLEERGGDYRFLHLTFQEYLCAYYLAETVRELDKIVTFLQERNKITQSWWRETILLVVGYLGLRSQENALDLVRRLADCGSGEETAMAASEVAAIAFLELNSKDETTSTLLTTQLIEQLISKSTKVLSLVRASAGRALGYLGDPRPGVGVKNGLPDIAWCQVEAGSFIMGGDGEYDGKPQFTCNLIREPYVISRYPITVAQYQGFIDAGGYQTEQYWTKAGWQWRKKEKITAPEAYSEVFGIANHPRVSVSWYEAVAYCGWLSAQMGKEIRLPSEAEWERAARHSDGRTYPWGNQEEYAQRCNMAESGIGSTSAVGIFPSGNAECGAADMAGNVWEWCNTAWHDDYESYEQKVNDDLTVDGSRVLRGGSFYGSRDYVRCASRYGLSPVDRYPDVGFRVVMSPGF